MRLWQFLRLRAKTDERADDFSMDRVLACGPSAAWLEAGWPATPLRDLSWRPAAVTGFIEPG